MFACLNSTKKNKKNICELKNNEKFPQFHLYIFVNNFKLTFSFLKQKSVLTESLETTLANESSSNAVKTPVDFRRPLKSRLQQSVNRLSIPKKKEGALITAASPSANNISSSEMNDLANTSLTTSTSVYRASTPQPQNTCSSSDSNHVNNQNSSETTSGVSSNTSSGSSLSKKVL